MAHAFEGVGTSGDHCVLHTIRHGFEPCGVAVNFVEYHLVFVSSAGTLWKLVRLVSEKGTFDIVYFDDNVVFC